ncbi:hypothetical protein DFH29DRAFT_1025658 [Suillus ampliporus]|nr:hypothetical protein DFH29DRAFT_1025658 [Suillus ampliporus]
MQTFIPSVLSALEALFKCPVWLLRKVISIFSSRSESPPLQISSDLYSQSDLPYNAPPSQQRPHHQPRPAVRHSQSQIPSQHSAHQTPSQHLPFQPRGQPSAQYPTRPLVPRDVPSVAEPRSRRSSVPGLATRAPDIAVAQIVIDPYEDPKSLRTKARNEGGRMDEYFKLRNETKDRNERQELTRKGEMHRGNMTLLNKEASTKIFQVDLHGLYVPEALSYFQEAVQGARDRGESSLRVIVGKGNHSDGNIPKIKPAIQAHARESLGLSIEVDSSNDGCLIVTFN